MLSASVSCTRTRCQTLILATPSTSAMAALTPSLTMTVTRRVVSAVSVCVAVTVAVSAMMILIWSLMMGQRMRPQKCVLRTVSLLRCLMSVIALMATSVMQIMRQMPSFRFCGSLLGVRAMTERMVAGARSSGSLAQRCGRQRATVGGSGQSMKALLTLVPGGHR